MKQSATKHQIEYRPMRLDEIDAFTALHKQCWREAYPLIMPLEYIESLDFEGRTKIMVEQLLEGKLKLLVATENGSLIGYSSACTPFNDKNEDPERVVELLGIYLLSRYWDKGIGKELFNQVIASIADWPYEKIVLWVLKDNHRAIHFYQRQGFVRDGTEELCNLKGFVFPEVRFVKQR
jgi:ribosomal protein S18 acetylase RimI-like enzyme